MRTVSGVTACAAVLLACAVASAEPSPPAQLGRRSISIVSATTLQRLVKLHVRVRGARRWTIFVDGRATGWSTSTTGFARVTRPGRHRISVGIAGLRSRTIDVTLPAPGGPLVAAAGDIACDPSSFYFNEGRGMARRCHQRATSDLLVNAGLRAVLPLGDLQYYCGAEAAFMASYDPSWGRVKAISHPTPGNHEYQSSGGYGCAPPGGQGYFAYWSPAAGAPAHSYYSFDLGSWHVVSLNSNCEAVGGCGAGSPQERWLKADLAARTRRCTLAYWHQPPFSSRVTPIATPRTLVLLQDLYKAGAEVLLNGDEHHYERFAQQTPQGAADPARGIREFVVGTGGEDLRPFGPTVANSEVRRDDTFGVLELTLLPGSYSWQFIPEAGGTFTDGGSSPCH